LDRGLSIKKDGFADAESIGYYLEGGNLPPLGAERPPSFATDQGDVWTGLIDTTEYENGLYDIAIITWDEKNPDGPPTALSQSKILISN
tara:strand:- start:205 stop:471 length:267 start_codon:yes stop_codon:yes gene_type:complete